MKQCPECKRTYADESLNFCLDDGAELVYGPAEPATKVLPHQKTASEQPTQTLGSVSRSAEIPSESVSKPARSSNNKTIAVVAAILLLAALSVGGYWYYGRTTKGQINSIAVLPFENGSGNADLDYLSDGVSESVIDRLSQLPQLKVIARSSSFRYRGQDLDLKEIAKALGVEALVTGRVVQHGDNYAIRVEMIDTRENRNIWSESFNRQVTDVQSLQADISRQIADSLRLHLSGEQSDRLAMSGTTNPQAYELLLQGRFYNNKVGTENRIKAAEYFQRSINIDPNYALAYAELSLTYSNLVGYSSFDPKEFMPKAEAAAQKAFALDNDLPQASYAMATNNRFDWQWSKAEQGYKHTIELNPNLARAYSGYALFLSVMGRPDEAIAEIKRAREFDPVLILINLNMGVIYYQARRYDEAIDVLQKTIELDKNVPFAHMYLGLSYSEKGLHERAIASMQQAIDLNEKTSKMMVMLGVVYARAGQRDKAKDTLKQILASSDYVSPAELARLYAALDEKDAALAALEKAYAEHDLQLQYINVFPQYDSLRSDRRFQDLLRKIGLS